MPKATKIILILAIIVVVGGVGFLIFFKPRQPPSINQPINTNTATPTDEVVISEADNWRIYKNSKFSFEMKVPKYSRFYQDEIWQISPVEVSEENNGDLVRISNIYQTKDYQNIFHELPRTWKISFKKVKNDAEIINFIKETYAPGCELGDLIYVPDNNLYNVHIKGDGKDLGHSICPINWIIVIKLNDKKDLIAYWDIGQSTSFPKITSDHGCLGPNCAYDFEMSDSFKFIK